MITNQIELQKERINLSPLWERKFFDTKELILKCQKNRAGVQVHADLVIWEPPLQFANVQE